MNQQVRSILKKSMKEAIVKTKVYSTDSDRDILGKLFNHFHQSLHGTSIEGWEISKDVPRRMKTFSNYSNDIAKYVAKLLTVALVEVNRLNRNNEFDALRESLCYMRTMAIEAKRVNETSEAVLSRLSDIERNMHNG